MAQYNVGRVRGSYIHYIDSQTDVPLNALLDDIGINTSTWDVYRFDGNAWIYIDNIHGVAAGFDTPSASATTLAAGSQATVSISSSGPDTAKKFDFTFGIPGSPIVTATVDNSEADLVGQAHVEVTNTGSTYAPNFEFAFKQLQGVGVQTIAITYQQGDSATVVPTGTWSDTPVEAEPGKYLWTRYIFNKTDGTNATAYSVARQGSPSDIVNVTALEGLGTDWLTYLQLPFLTGNIPINGNLTVTGNITTTGDLTAQGDTLLEDTTVNNLVIQGNVTQQGSSFITEAETVEVKDNMLVLNNGETGAGVTAGQAGIEIDRGTSNPFFFIFNEDSDRFEVGTEGDLQPVMLRDTEANLTDTNILVWDAANKRAVTSSVNVGDLTQLNLNTRGSYSDNGYVVTKAEGNTIIGRRITADDINGCTHPWFREYLSLQVYATIDWDRYYSIFNVDSDETVKFGGVGDRYTVDYAYVSSGTNTYNSAEILKVYPTNITFGDRPLAIWGDRSVTSYDTYKLYKLNFTINGTVCNLITNAPYSSSVSIFAPTTAGISGQILQSDGTSIPKWVNKTEYMTRWPKWSEISEVPNALSDLSNFTGNRAVITNANGVLDSSPITNTELLALDGISTSQTIQAQLNGKLSLSGGTMTGAVTFNDSISFTNGSIDEDATPEYFLTMDAFADGGAVHWTSAADVRTAIGAASTSQLNDYLPLGGGTLTGNLTLGTSYDIKFNSEISLQTSNDSMFITKPGASDNTRIEINKISNTNNKVPTDWYWYYSSTSFANGYWGNLYSNNSLVATQDWVLGQISGSGGGTIVSVEATGTAPLTLSASTSSGAVTISGSVAAASASASGVVTTGTQTFAGAKTFNGLITSSTIVPRSDSSYNIGTSSNRYATIYADTLYGNLVGNASSATSASTASTASKLGSSDVGSSTKLIYLDGGSPAASTATVGNIAKPVYLNAGAITALTATVGSSTKPVYLNGGQIADCGPTLSVGITGNAASATSASNADKVDGKHIVVTNTAPDASADPNTIYFVTD